MDKKRMLKGFMKLMFALIITCGVGLFTMGKDVKAATTLEIDDDANTFTTTKADLSYTLKVGSGETSTVTKVEVVAGGQTVKTLTGSDISASETGVSHTIKSLDLLIWIVDKGVTLSSVDKITLQPDGGVSPVTTANNFYSIYTVKLDGGATVPHTNNPTLTVSSNGYKKGADVYGFDGCKVVASAGTDSGYRVLTWTASGGVIAENVITVNSGDVSGIKPSDVEKVIGRVEVYDTSAPSTPISGIVYLAANETKNFKIVAYDIDGGEMSSSEITSYSVTSPSSETKITFTPNTYNFEAKATSDATDGVTKSCIAAATHNTITKDKEIIFQVKNTPAPEPTFTCSVYPDPASNHIGLAETSKDYRVIIKKDGSEIGKDSKADVVWTIPTNDIYEKASTSTTDVTGDTVNLKPKKAGSYQSTYIVNYDGKKVYDGSATFYVDATPTPTDPKVTLSASPATIDASDDVTIKSEVDPNTLKMASAKLTYYCGTKAIKSFSGTNIPASYSWPAKKGSDIMSWAKSAGVSGSLYGEYSAKIEATFTGVSSPVTAECTFTIDTPSVEITKLTLNNTYVTVGESTLVSASFTLSEKVDSDFTEDILDSFEIEYDGKYIDSDDDINVVLASGKKSGTVSFGVKGKSVGTDSVTFSSDLYEKDEITKPIYVVAGPAITQDYKADNHTIKFTLPTYVGTYMSPNMGVTGYRLLIYQGDTVKKTLDRVTTGSKEVSVNVEELLSSIDLTGDSYTFKIGVEPVGKNNYGTSDVSDAQKSTSTTSKPDPLVAKTTDITAYKVAITAGADVTVSPSTVWGLPGQEVKLTASTSKAGADSSNIAWTKSGSNSALQRGSTYSYKVSTTTGDNKLTAQLAANSNSSSSGGGATPGTNSGSGANAEGLDDVPKTAESNAPIWLIIVLVFAAMGGAYALYMQMRPATVDNAPSEFGKNDDDYDDNF